MTPGFCVHDSPLDQLIAAEKEAAAARDPIPDVDARGVFIATGAETAYTQADATLIALLRNHVADLLAVVKACALAIPVSACDYPDGACEHECGRTADDHSGCLRIKALEALSPLLTTEGSDD